jgi:hypothetical protein
VQALHSGADLNASAQAAAGALPAGVKGYLGYVQAHQGDHIILPLVENAVEARTELAAALPGNRRALAAPCSPPRAGARACTRPCLANPWTSSNPRDASSPRDTPKRCLKWRSKLLSACVRRRSQIRHVLRGRMQRCHRALEGA